MKLSLIVAVAKNGVIGRDDGMPWHLSADLQRFKELTMGRAMIMGRKTYESIGRPLPGRRSVIVSRNPALTIAGCDVVRTLPEAIQRAADHEEAFVIGGRQIYELAVPVVDRIYWTQVHAEIEGDVYFPSIDWESWQLVDEVDGSADDRNDHDYSFRTFERSSSNGQVFSDDMDSRR